MINRNCACVFVLCAAALAVSAASAGSAGRFELKPAGDGFLRLDSHTGAISQCVIKDAVWRCTSVVDDRRALHDEIDRLKAENRRLRDRLTGEPGGRTIQVPSDADLDKVMGFFEKMLERFVTFTKKMEKKPGEPI